MAYPMQPITFTASATLSKKSHADTVLLLSAAAGLTMTLPASSGDGTTFRFFVKTTVTSNNDIIQVANSTDVMQGSCVMATAAASDNVVAFETAATSDTITMNGSTKGGLIGDYIELQDVSLGFWQLKMVCQGTGSTVTPFSAAV